MDAILSTLASGLVLGSLYAIMAVGLTVIYGVSHVFNFAHGHVAVLGGYLAWLVIGTGIGFGLGFTGGVITSSVVMAALGWFLYRYSVRSLLRRDGWEFATLLFTLGLGILLQFSMLSLFGPRIKSIPTFSDASIRLWFGRVGVHEIIVLVLAIVLLAGLEMFLKRTTMGQAMRAVSESVEGARIVGINIDRVYGYTFALTFVVTGISGILLGSTVFMTPHIGWEWMIKGFIIVSFGGLGSVPGAILAAFVLGAVESFVSLYGGALWVWPAWLGLFVLVLVIRPQGILGGRTA